MNLADLLTVYIPTSPLHSHPKTIHIQRAIKTINKLWGLQNCQKIIVCDGFPTDPEKLFTKWSFALQAGLDPNTVTKNQYHQYKTNLHRLCQTDQAFANVRIEELTEHLRLSGITRHIYQQITTPLILNFEHDFYACAELNLQHITTRIYKSNIHYLRFNTNKNVRFADGGYVYDTVLHQDPQTPIAALKTDGWTSAPHIIDEWQKEFILNLPTGTGYHYQMRTKILDDIYEHGFQKAHAKYGCYVYGEPQQAPVVRHLDGLTLPEELTLLRSESARTFKPRGIWHHLMDNEVYTDL
jgi:hypothetical protein